MSSWWQFCNKIPEGWCTSKVWSSLKVKPAGSKNKTWIKF
jgi:hypothetical protein